MHHCRHDHRLPADVSLERIERRHGSKHALRQRIVGALYCLRHMRGDTAARLRLWTSLAIIPIFDETTYERLYADADIASLQRQFDRRGFVLRRGTRRITQMYENRFLCYASLDVVVVCYGMPDSFYDSLQWDALP